VTVDANGNSKGSGFVAFSTPEEASKAVSHNYVLLKKSSNCYFIFFVMG